MVGFQLTFHLSNVVVKMQIRESDDLVVAGSRLVLQPKISGEMPTFFRQIFVFDNSYTRWQNQQFWFHNIEFSISMMTNLIIVTASERQELNCSWLLDSNFYKIWFLKSAAV